MPRVKADAAPMDWKDASTKILAELQSRRAWERALEGAQDLSKKVMSADLADRFNIRVIKSCILAKYWCDDDAVDWWKWHRERDREFALAAKGRRSGRGATSQGGAAQAARELAAFMSRFEARATWPARIAARAWGIQIADAPDNRGLGITIGGDRLEGPLVPQHQGAVSLEKRWDEYAMGRVAGGSNRPFHAVFAKFLEELASELEKGSLYRKPGVGAYERCGPLLFGPGHFLAGKPTPRADTLLAFDLAVLFRCATSGEPLDDGMWPGLRTSVIDMPKGGKPHFDIIAPLVRAVFPDRKTRAGGRPAQDRRSQPDRRPIDAKSLSAAVNKLLSAEPPPRWAGWPDPEIYSRHARIDSSE
jgi:hypothetical protein